MPDRLLGIDHGGSGERGRRISHAQELLVAGWLESSWSRLLTFTKRNTMRAMSVHYDAEDVLQDAIFRALRNPENTVGLNDAKSFERWMKRVILNRVLDLRRMVSVREVVWPAQSSATDAEGDDWNRLESLPDQMIFGADPALLEGEGAGTILAREFKDLPFDEHVCVLMRDVMKVGWSAVSATLGRSTNGAKSLRHRARGRFL